MLLSGTRYSKETAAALLRSSFFVTQERPLYQRFLQLSFSGKFLPHKNKVDNTMDNLDFSVEEIQQQLAVLGYRNIPKHRLLEFKQDLDKVIRHGQWKNLASATPTNINSQTATSHSSPPAYTKEKVSLLYSKGSSAGFFMHQEKTYRDTKKNKNNSWPMRHCDSYAEQSVGPRLQLPAGAPNRLQEEPDTEDTLDSLLSESYTSFSEHQERRFIKRKVLRKRKGKSLICDESVYTEDSVSHLSCGSLQLLHSYPGLLASYLINALFAWPVGGRPCIDATSRLEEQIAELDLSTSHQKDDEAESEDVSDESDYQSSETDGVDSSAFESYIKGMIQTQSYQDVRPKPKSFIRPVMCQPVIKKTDPVAKYFQYKQMWEMFQVSGEKDRKALRWEIKEKLAYQPLPNQPLH
ncbi:hydrolethalus syndrome protein 1 homolog isoform X4 [Girardinichthys multiradiatus]|uniref:hydrolethalus syndrome protein 1 homolog isoform X4 n=1 Tax=Girardinichthys multiradiatus TaxID=208333 RepID=UPI001FAC9E5F|nr:hydrolethalus syndrome protein 1 homolog isoform X4 [Girardinichthys multiradiatus]